MKVFLLGATGSIGSGLCRALVSRGIEVTALCRSETARTLAADMGARPLLGDLRRPETWAAEAVAHDGIIHAATVPFHEMPQVDRRVIDELLRAAVRVSHQPRLIYSCSCWFYGANGDHMAPEGPPFDCHRAFKWMIEGAERLFRSQAFSTAVIVPGMVYHADGGGVFRRFLPAIAQGTAVEIWGSAKTRWPLIHRDDLSEAYLALLAQPDLTGYFNGATEPGVPVGEIVSGLMTAAQVSVPVVELPVDEVERCFGAWASGATLDQKMGAERLRLEAHWQPQITRWQDSDLLRQLSSGVLHNRPRLSGSTPQ